jgi:signal transduction histidine kinase
MEKIEANPEQTISKDEINRLIKGEANEIQSGIRRITNNTRMFGRIVAQKKNEHLRVDEIIGETVSLLRDISDKAHVKMYFSPPNQLIVIRNQAAALEQILLNVMLNAVQQIHEFHKNNGGWIHIWIETFINSSNENWFRVAIEDNGPGIHTNLWEKIFEAGFTTRSDGSGIGLYLSRSIVDNLGGKLYVNESYILSGAAFSLELPYSL